MACLFTVVHPCNLAINGLNIGTPTILFKHFIALLLCCRDRCGFKPGFGYSEISNQLLMVMLVASVYRHCAPNVNVSVMRSWIYIRVLWSAKSRSISSCAECLITSNNHVLSSFLILSDLHICLFVQTPFLSLKLEGELENQNYKTANRVIMFLYTKLW